MPKYNHEILTVDINLVHPNPYNPNVVEDSVFEQLKKNIIQEGLIGAIVVRDDKEKSGEYVIIDGEHRWRAAKDVGYKEIPIIVLDRKLPDAMIATINFNKLRGELDTIKLAEVIHELNKTYSTEELEDRLGYTSEELLGMEELLQYDFENVEEKPIKLSSTTQSEYTFEVVLSAVQYKTIEGALATAKKSDNAEAITVICSEYLKRHGKERK